MAHRLYLLSPFQAVTTGRLNSSCPSRVLTNMCMFYASVEFQYILVRSLGFNSVLQLSAFPCSDGGNPGLKAAATAAQDIPVRDFGVEAGSDGLKVEARSPAFAF